MFLDAAAREVLALQKAKIPFALVPGVTSAVAVSELAGIPLTHRKESRSFHVFTGHTKEGAEQSFFPYYETGWHECIFDECRKYPHDCRPADGTGTG